MEIKNNNYWANKKEDEKKEENNSITFNNKENNKIKITVGIITIVTFIGVIMLYIYIEKEKKERITKINEQINKRNQEIILNQNINIQNNINSEYLNYSKNSNFKDENTMKIYTKFKGCILNYRKNDSIVIVTILTDSYKTEYIKTTENIIQNIQNKIDTKNNFEFTCQSKRGNYLEDCEIY